MTNTIWQSRGVAENCPPWIGLDIGGANIKSAHTNGWSANSAFPMWKQPRSLSRAVATLLQEAPAFIGVALTMTGELADCFETRAEGVAVILEQVTSVLPSSMVRVYSVDGAWLLVPQAARKPWDVAASNWHGLSKFCSRFVPCKTCLLMDVGSTTTDIVPLVNGMIAIDARTDSQRLQAGALVYTGIERSNVAGIVRELTLHGTSCPIMNELFATTMDAYLWLGMMDDDSSNRDTADGQPATRQAARFRLARLVGEDGSTLTDSDIDILASQVFSAQQQMISTAIRKLFSASIAPDGKQVTQPKRRNSKKPSAVAKDLVPFGNLNAITNQSVGSGFECVIMSGHGDFLIEAVLAHHLVQADWGGQKIRLGEILGSELSRCAPAFAIAVLASEEVGLKTRDDISCDGKL